jgi:hypothetical protein
VRSSGLERVDSGAEEGGARLVGERTGRIWWWLEARAGRGDSVGLREQGGAGR